MDNKAFRIIDWPGLVGKFFIGVIFFADFLSVFLRVCDVCVPKSLVFGNHPEGFPPHGDADLLAFGNRQVAEDVIREVDF